MENVETVEAVEEFVPTCKDADGKPIALNSLVYIAKSSRMGKNKPFRVREISYQYQSDGNSPVAFLTLAGRKDRIRASVCAVVDESTDFGRVAALIERVGGRVDPDVIYEYLGKQSKTENEEEGGEG